MTLLKKIMNNRVIPIQVNLYSISSDFKDIMLRLCESFIKKSQKAIIMLKDIQELEDLDKFLWTRNKNSFIPHKSITDQILETDSIILSYNNLNGLKVDKKFDTLIISPYRSIKTFKLFKKYLVFSYKKNNSVPKLYKDKLESKGFNVVCYDEYEKFKWKVS